MRRLLPLLALLAACAQGPTLGQRLSTFVGRTEGDLVAALGVPVRVHEADDRRFLQFEQRRLVPVAPPSPFLGYGAGPWGPTFGYWQAVPTVTPLRCEQTFEIRNGRVETFSYRGDGC